MKGSRFNASRLRASDKLCGKLLLSFDKYKGGCVEQFDSGFFLSSLNSW